MTLQDIRTMLTSIDESIQHYHSGEQYHDEYTTWTEYRRMNLTADDGHIEGWAFQVDRFTCDEFDQMARRIFEALDADPRVTVIHTVDYEPETGYIHHIYDCEAV